MIANAVVVTDTNRRDGREIICRVDTAAVLPHRQCADFIEHLGEYPELLALVMAAKAARARNLPIVGPWGTIVPEAL
jgi:hypothetical protein